MSYQTPKTDWTVEDGVSTADINRWEGNPEAIKNEDIEFNGIKTFNDNIIQAWGKSGLLCKPALTSGMGTVINRSDSETELSVPVDDSSWHTIKTLSLNSFFPSGSYITVYWQDDDDTMPSHDVRLLVNGSQYYINENEDGGYFTRTISNVPAGPNYTYSVQMKNYYSGMVGGDLKVQYFRLWCAETIVLTTWEKAVFGLSG